MQFKKAYALMKDKGIPIKLPEWEGYWAWEEDSIKMHCKDGVVIDIRESKDISYTFGFIIRDDWMIADDETNSKLLQEEVVNTFSLGEAIIIMEEAKPGKVLIARKGWNGKDQYLYYMGGAELSTGLKYGFGEYEGEPRFIDVIVLKTTNNILITGWTPTTTDLLARDYYIVTKTSKED